MTIHEYIRDVEHALNKNRINIMKSEIYEGKDGSLRLAREIGYGLADYTEKERFDVMGSLYGIFAVKFYNLKPTVDSKEFYKEINNSIKKALNFRNGAKL